MVTMLNHNILFLLQLRIQSFRKVHRNLLVCMQQLFDCIPHIKFTWLCQQANHTTHIKTLSLLSSLFFEIRPDDWRKWSGGGQAKTMNIQIYRSSTGIMDFSYPSCDESIDILCHGLTVRWICRGWIESASPDQNRKLSHHNVVLIVWIVSGV